VWCHFLSFLSLHSLSFPSFNHAESCGICGENIGYDVWWKNRSKETKTVSLLGIDPYATLFMKATAQYKLTRIISRGPHLWQLWQEINGPFLGAGRKEVRERNGKGICQYIDPVSNVQKQVAWHLAAARWAFFFFPPHLVDCKTRDIWGNFHVRKGYCQRLNKRKKNLQVITQNWESLVFCARAPFPYTSIFYWKKNPGGILHLCAAPLQAIKTTELLRKRAETLPPSRTSNQRLL
jgi:hypothetical protein